MRELEANKKQFKKKTEKGLTYLIKYELKHSDAPCDTVRTVESGGERSPEIESISSDEDEDGLADDAQLTAAEILKKAERNAKGGDWKARQLRAGRIMDHTEVLELRPTVAFIKPYNGYLGEKSYGPGGPPKSWGWIRKLVCEFVDGTMLRFFNSDKPLELLREEKHRVQQSEVVLDRHIEQHRNERAAYEVRLLLACVTETMRSRSVFDVLTIIVGCRCAHRRTHDGHRSQTNSRRLVRVDIHARQSYVVAHQRNASERTWRRHIHTCARHGFCFNQLAVHDSGT